MIVYAVCERDAAYAISETPERCGHRYVTFHEALAYLRERQGELCCYEDFEVRRDVGAEGWHTLILRERDTGAVVMLRVVPHLLLGQ